ncbi:MAG: RdgB/HAM1 family non-canonical purine NTP pyrophosphatase [Acidobacteriota bacterium]|nr:RdgB/HAM1 family non-canonical purine NTP pyrophosphatase [Bryobacteraceae bacterium CoA2 C42]
MIVRCATTNPGKLREFRLIFEAYGGGGIDLRPLEGLAAIAAPEETGATFAANAALKACYYSAFTEDLLFADDSGLEVEALRGAPGVYSARYAGPAATDAENNAKVLAALAGSQERAARFVCSIALARGGKLLGTFTDAVEGWMTEEARGSFGFGYDPLFYYEPFGGTFGETAPERKLLVSHRGKALARLIREL